MAIQAIDGCRLFEDTWRLRLVPIVDDHRGLHGEQLFGREDQLLIRQTSNNYLFKDYPRTVDVQFKVCSQGVSGSTDAKLMSFVDDLSRCACAECCIVLFGHGFGSRAIRNTTRRAGELSGHNKHIRVMCAVGNVLDRHVKSLIDHGKFL